MEDNFKTIEEQVKGDRFRNFMLVFYDTSDYYNIDELLFNIKGFKYYAYIKHKAESDEKQDHYHCFIHLDNACTIKALSDKIGLPIQYIQPSRNIRSCCRYLTHIDYIDKIPYDISSVVVSGLFERKFKKQYEDIKTEEEIILDIYNFIDNLQFDNYFTAMRYLILYVNTNCYDTIYKRYRSEFNDYIKQLF